ncbi:DUF397 domain-containing protein [Sphaerisporangium fuscum]|uniref:DUF397 domain-containing protein n=1 Tax=Sphaerisporangium fuscum TaxID=2835868 RepID=UPI001BDC13D7|nr:DUF397 domain-containing protein [Sphaerisporangium fuscum]
MENLTNARWVKSSYSGNNGGDCVELASLTGNDVAIRDSKRPAGPVLRFGAAEWGVFRRSVKDGTLDGMTG